MYRFVLDSFLSAHNLRMTRHSSSAARAVSDRREGSEGRPPWDTQQL
jgi:hypothetical protein